MAGARLEPSWPASPNMAEAKHATPQTHLCGGLALGTQSPGACHKYVPSSGCGKLGLDHWCPGSPGAGLSRGLSGLPSEHILHLWPNRRILSPCQLSPLISLRRPPPAWVWCPSDPECSSIHRRSPDCRHLSAFEARARLAGSLGPQTPPHRGGIEPLPVVEGGILMVLSVLEKSQIISREYGLH